MNEVDYKTKTMKPPLIALLMLLLCATAPAQESVQDQLDRIRQAQQDAQAQYDVDQIHRRSEADARHSFRECVEQGLLSPEQCANIFLPDR